jgi:hypothetical protein
MVPIVLMLVFYFVAIRGMEVGGGPGYELVPLLTKTASYMLSGPATSDAAGAVALIVVAAVCVALIYLIFERDDRWIFYAVVIVAPLGMIAIQRPEQLYVRYFMISLASALLLLASSCAALLRRGVAAAAIGLALLALYATGNAANTLNLIRFGRGQYLAALRFMESHSDSREVLITSDHDFRNGMLVNYHKRYLERPDDIHYLDRETLNQEYARTNGSSLGAEWLILHRFNLTKPAERVTDTFGNSYQLVTIYRYSDVSGWNWLVYHNRNRPPLTP